MSAQRETRRIYKKMLSNEECEVNGQMQVFAGWDLEQR